MAKKKVEKKTAIVAARPTTTKAKTAFKKGSARAVPVPSKAAGKAAKPSSVKAAAKKVAKVMTKPVKPVVKPSAKPAVKPGKPAAKPVVKTAIAKAAKPAAKNNKAAVKQNGKVSKSIAKPAAKPVAKSIVKSQVKPTAKPVVSKFTPVEKVLRKIDQKVPKKLVVDQEVTTPSEDGFEETGGERAYGSYGGIMLCENPKLFPKKTPYTDKEIKALHEMLLEERKHLREVLRDLEEITLRRPSGESDNEVTGYSIHWAENATDNISKETALLLRRDEENTLVQVDAALERIERGLFGVCVACGEKIGMGRLKAKPEAHLCLRCKQIYDKESNNR